MIIRVNSANIKQFEYFDRERILKIRFVNAPRMEYSYLNVPKPVYINLLKSESKGSFFHSQIKSKYRFTKSESE